MDLRLYARVVRRFWPLVACGFTLGAALAVLSMFRVSNHGGLHLAPRQQKVWKGSETLLLTQQGFPWGRTVYPYAVNKKTGQLLPSTSLADPSRFTDVAVLYAEVANGDAVHRLVFGNRRPDGSFSASVVVNTVGSHVVGAQPITQIVPILEIDGYAPTAARALTITSAAASSLQRYIEQSQQRAGIPAKQRILIQVLSAPQKATVSRGYKLTTPIVAFLGILIAALLMAFVLENLRPRGGASENDEVEVEESEPAPERRAPSLPAAPGVATLGSSLGGRLREARVRRGLDLRLVGEQIDVEAKYLRALEAERFDLLPDEDAAKAALDAYADRLEVDVEMLLADLGGLPVEPNAGRGRHNGDVKALRLSVPVLVAALAAAIVLLGRDVAHDGLAARSVLHAFTVSSGPAATVTDPLHAADGSTRPSLARLAVTATRGTSRVVLRAGSSGGRVLFARTLRRGEAVRRTGKRLWLQLGAGSNVDVRVNGGRPISALHGAVDAVVSGAGFREVPLGR